VVSGVVEKKAKLCDQYPFRAFFSSSSEHPMAQKCLDIVGLTKNDNGRSCESHEVCGDHVKVDDILQVEKCIVTINGVNEGALAAYKLSNGQKHCRVGFVARHLIRRVKEGTLLQVLTIYQDSESEQDRKRAYRNGGMCLCAVLAQNEKV
jgi:hypothetical protein